MFKNEDGAVLVLSIIVILVLTVLATALVGSINNNISFTKRHENDVKAFYAAEAGIEQGINVIYNDSNPVTDGIITVGENEDDLLFDYEITEETDHPDADYKIVSEAEINGIYKKLTVKIKKNNSANGMFNNSLTTNGDLNIDKSTYANNGAPTIDGDIYANQLGIGNKFSFAQGTLNANIFANEIGLFEISGTNINGDITADKISTETNDKLAISSKLNGDIYANEIGVLQISNEGMDGEIHTNSITANQSFKEIQELEKSIETKDNMIPDFSEYFNSTDKINVNNTNNIKFDENKVYEYNGDLEDPGIKDGNGILVVNGDLDLNSPFKVNHNPNDEEFLILLVDGNIQTDMHVEGNVFMYATGRIDIQNNPGGNLNGNGNPGKTKITGSLMAEEGITMNDPSNQGLELINDPNFTEIFKSHGYGIPPFNGDNSNNNSTTSIEIVEWREN